MFKIDKEIKELIPPLTDEEYQQLKENILADGCREPLVIWNGTIVDGHNRYKICTENSVDYQTVEKGFSGKQEVVEWVIKNQFGRRNLSLFQRSELALKLKPVIREKAKENQSAAGGDKKSLCQIFDKAIIDTAIDTKKEIAKIAGVSHGTIMKVERIKNQGTPEQIQRAEKGGKGNSISAIYKEIKESNEKAEEQKQCKDCKQLLPLSFFYKGKNSCKSCCNSKESKFTDFLGRPQTLTDEFKECNSEDIVGDLYDVDKVVERTIDGLIEEFTINFESSYRMLKDILESNKELLTEKQNKEKMAVVLSEAAAAMTSLKGEYINE